MVNNVNPSGQLSNAQGAGQQQSQFDPWIIWVTFRRCWPWAMPIGAVLSGIVAFVVLQTFVPRYRATALLEANDTYILFKGVMPTVDDLARSEKAFIEYPIVLGEVLDNPDLRNAPSLRDPETAEANLRKNLSVSAAGSKKRMTISYVDTNRAAAAEICNAVVESYLRRRGEFDSSRVNDLERSLLPEIEKWEHDVEDHELRVQQLSKTTRGYSPNQRAAVMEDENHMALVTDLRRQINELEVEITLFDVDQKLSQSDSTDEAPIAEPAFVPPQITVERTTPSESEILIAVLNNAKVTEAQMLVDRYKSAVLELEDNGLARIRREYYLEQLGKRDEWITTLEQRKKDVRPAVEETLNALADENFQRLQRDADQQVETARREYLASIEQAKLQRLSDQTNAKAAEKQQRQLLAERLIALQQKYKVEREQLEQYNVASIELDFAYDDLDVAKAVLIKLRDRAAAIETERQSTASVRTLAPATPPKSPVEEIPLKKLMAASGLAFVVPFLFGLLWEFKVQRVTDSASMEKINALAPVVGEVAKLPSGAGSGRGRRLFEESIDTLRANIFLSADTRNSRTIAVASSMSGEGKSSVASQLAISIAKATGETVLLVDADLRCPDQHEIFGLEMGPGLTGVLSGEATLGEATDKTLGDLIHVLPAGRLSSSPHRLMSPPALRSFLDDASHEYTYVVVDTAPVLSASETLAISAAVDSTLLCVMRDVSRMESVSKSTRRLEAAGANLAGTVFSGVTARQYAYRYGDYHYALGGDVGNEIANV